MESEKKKNAMQRTVVSLKAEIKMLGQEIERLDNVIVKKQSTIKELDESLKENKDTMLSFADSATTTFSGQITKIKDAISQRNLINHSIKALEKSKLAVEIEIAEKKQKTFKSTGLGFIQSAIKEVGNSLNSLTKKENDTKVQILKLKREEANLFNSTVKLKTEKVTSEQTLKILEVEAKTIEKKREANLKELAREQVKVRSIRNAERDIQAMRRRLTDEYKKVYKSNPRRSII